MPACEPVDLGERDQMRLAVRIGRAWVELRRGAAMNTLRDHLFGSGDGALDQGQADTLDLLATRPAWRMNEAAEALRVDPSTATRAIQRLVNDGLAERQACGEDGRGVIVSVSAKGAERHRELAARRTLLMSHLLAAFTADERERLAEMLERFVATLDDYVDGLAPADD